MLGAPLDGTRGEPRVFGTATIKRPVGENGANCLAKPAKRFGSSADRGDDSNA